MYIDYRIHCHNYDPYTYRRMHLIFFYYNKQNKVQSSEQIEESKNFFFFFFSNLTNKLKSCKSNPLIHFFNIKNMYYLSIHIMQRRDFPCSNKSKALLISLKFSSCVIKLSKLSSCICKRISKFHENITNKYCSQINR